MQSLHSFYEKLQFSFRVIGGVLREYAYENFGLKLIALLIAIVLWGAVSKQEMILGLPLRLFLFER